MGTTRVWDNILCASAGLIALGLLNASPVLAQPQSGTPLAFEVASVKLSKPGGRSGGIRPLPGGQTYIAQNAPVKLIMKLMFHLTDQQISGAPSWFDTEFYDVEAKAEHPSTLEQLHQMFQSLLIERFKIQFHRETRELPTYLLTVDKSGSKMKVNNSPNDFSDFPLRAAGRGKMLGERESMSHFAWSLAQQLGRPVVDKTGLDGNYDFTFEFTPEPVGLKGAIEARDAPPASDSPSIFVALKEQLGLKLESHKGPVEILVIDHAEKPSEN